MCAKYCNLHASGEVQVIPLASCALPKTNIPHKTTYLISLGSMSRRCELLVSRCSFISECHSVVLVHYPIVKKWTSHEWSDDVVLFFFFTDNRLIEQEIKIFKKMRLLLQHLSLCNVRQLGVILRQPWALPPLLLSAITAGGDGMVSSDHRVWNEGTCVVCCDAAGDSVAGGVACWSWQLASGESLVAAASRKPKEPTLRLLLEPLHQ